MRSEQREEVVVFELSQQYLTGSHIYQTYAETNTSNRVVSADSHQVVGLAYVLYHFGVFRVPFVTTVTFSLETTLERGLLADLSLNYVI